MACVYILGAYLPNGGTLMAYHLGLVVSEVMGLNPVAVSVKGEKYNSNVFTYPKEIGSVSMVELQQFVSKHPGS